MIFKEVAAIAQKLESTQSRITSSLDFFLPILVDLRSQLCQSCFELWFADEFKLEYYRRAEEVLWRRVYHDIYKLYKANRTVLIDREIMLIEAHFFAGIGLYSSLIVRLRLHYKMPISKKLLVPLGLHLESLDDVIVAIGREQRSLSKLNKEPQENELEALRLDWAQQAVYRCLVYMGDLYRYLIETNRPECRSLAIKLYKSTSLYDPYHGMPFNQLATMSGNDNYALDAICNYMRCCSRAKPFEGAAGNMKKIFDINAKIFDEVNRKGQNGTFNDSNKNRIEYVKGSATLMRRLIVTFIKLVSDLWQGVSDQDDDQSFELYQKTIASEIRLFFVLLKEAMDVPRPELTQSNEPFKEVLITFAGGCGITEKPVFVSTTIMYEFANISLMLLARCQLSVKVNSRSACMIYESAVALTLNLLHYVTTRCHQSITTKIRLMQEIKTSNQAPAKMDGQNLLDQFRTRLANSKENITTSLKYLGHDDQSSASTPNLSPRRALSRMRQREAAVNYTDGPIAGNYNFDYDNSDMSELEETALSTIDALEISSEMNEAENQIVNKAQNLIDLDSSDDEQTISIPDQIDMENGSFFQPLNDPSIVIAHISRVSNKPVFPSIINEDAILSTPVPDLLTGDLIPTSDLVTSNCKLDRLPKHTNGGNLSASSLSPIDYVATMCAQHYEDDRNCIGGHGNITTNFTYIMEFIYNETYLPSIKIFCDWLLSNSSLISINCESFKAFFGELDILINALKQLQEYADQLESSTIGGTVTINNDQRQMVKSSIVLENRYDGPAWIQKYPLSVDLPLLKLKSLEAVHKLNIDYDSSVNLNEAEMGFLCIQCIFAFADVVTLCFSNVNPGTSSK